MSPQLEEKIRKYLNKFPSSEILEKMKNGDFPFFGMRERDCENLAWEIIAERRFKD